MGAMFSTPKIPPPTPTPDVPDVDDAQMRIEQSRRARRTRAGSNMVLVNAENQVGTAARKLTGN